MTYNEYGLDQVGLSGSTSAGGAMKEGDWDDHKLNYGEGIHRWIPPKSGTCPSVFGPLLLPCKSQCLIKIF